jgi:uncharacterized RDD family membrane protein YckC
MLVLLLAILVLSKVFSVIGDALFADDGVTRGWVTAVKLLLTFVIFWGYFTLFEALNGGRTPGKQALGIRVVMDTGQAITPSAAVVRNLVRVIDCYIPVPFAPALFSMFLHPSNKRPGDMAAGTIVVRDRPTDWVLSANPTAAEPEGAEPIETGPPISCAGSKHGFPVAARMCRGTS